MNLPRPLIALFSLTQAFIVVACLLSLSNTVASSSAKTTGFLHAKSYLAFATASAAHTKASNTEPLASSPNQPPVGEDDTLLVHGVTSLAPLLANDYDPDGNPIFLGGFPTEPQHGQIFFGSYHPDSAYTGADSFSYEVCDNQGACDTANVTVDVRNEQPNANDDSYQVHGATTVGPLLQNDSDQDNDALSLTAFITSPEHGDLINSNTPDIFSYRPAYGFRGQDGFVYKVCDSLGACDTASVTLNVTNAPPTPVDKGYQIRSNTIIGPIVSGDTDPDGDGIGLNTLVTSPEHGGLFNTGTIDVFEYRPDLGFTGSDSFVYRECDNLGACSNSTVTLHVIGDGEKNGVCSGCNNGGPAAVAEPINVTNGNMYLQQGDYHLSGVGYAIDVTRTYNSDAQQLGFFGRGWSTAYDESIVVYDSSLVRFNRADGRAIYLGRLLGSSGGFAPLVGDFHGSLIQNGGSGFTVTMIDGSVRQFNAAGKLLSFAHRVGNQTTLAYDAGGKLTSVTDASGRVLSFTTNANGQVLSIADTLGTVATYTYGGGNELLSVTYADNSAFNFAYDGSLRLMTVTDAMGNIVESHTYDGLGRAITSETQGGVDRYSLSYVNANETDVTDGLGRVTKYIFDKSKGRNVVTRLEGLCNCGGGSGSQVQTWTYDNQLNVTAKTDALNHVTSYTYDANGNRLTETDALGTTTYTYNNLAEVLTTTDKLGGVATNTFDSAGNLLTMTDARGKTTNFINDSRGLLLNVTDARGKVTSFAYDASGNLITRTDALWHDTQFAYDARGRLISTTNALGFVTSFAYDPVGRLTQVTQSDGTTNRYEYDLAGRRIAMTDAKGNRSTFAYDAANRLINQTDALNQVTAYSYDLMSSLTSTTNALGQTTNFDYDDFNRLVKTTYPAATAGATRLFETVEYDAGGNVVKSIDTAGRTTEFHYDELSRVTSTTDADNKITSFEYDPLSRVTGLVDAIGQRYRFNYNPVGAITHLRRGTTVASFTYDAVGNRKTRTDYNGALTVYDYDALNRLKTISYPDATGVDYTYDKLSRLQTAANQNGTLNFDYNKLNRLIRATDVFGQVVEYSFDPNGNRTKLSLNAATIATYRYDAIDRLTKILDAASLATNYTYDVTNRLTSRKLPNGVLTSYQYDGLDRLTRLLDAKGVTTLADHQYQYNTASEIMQIAEPTNTKSYGYNVVDRLTSVAYTNPSQQNESYSFDSVGNRTASHLSATYGYQPFNRLTSTASAAYSYDANGNLISKTNSNGTTQCIWDFENRLNQVTLPNGSTVNYKYDSLGRRIQRTPSVGVSTNFIYDGQDVVKDLNSDGSTVDYMNGPGIDNKLRLTDSRLAATGPLYFQQDQVGSTTVLTNSLGVSVAQLTYDAFGNSSGTPFTRYDYTGRERDPDTGLMYYRARWYDPQVGRFISEDPIFLEGGLNLFEYLTGNPLRSGDPFGLLPQNPPTARNATPSQQVRFNAAYREVLKRLDNCECAKAFGGKAKALAALSGTGFSFAPVEGGAAETVGNAIRIDPSGAFMAINGRAPTSSLPNSIPSNYPLRDTSMVLLLGNRKHSGVFNFITPGDLDASAFILLHELGHRANIYGDEDNDGNDPVASALNNEKIRKACFKELKPQPLKF